MAMAGSDTTPDGFWKIDALAFIAPAALRLPSKAPPQTSSPEHSRTRSENPALFCLPPISTWRLECILGRYLTMANVVRFEDSLCSHIVDVFERFCQAIANLKFGCPKA